MERGLRAALSWRGCLVLAIVLAQAVLASGALAADDAAVTLSTAALSFGSQAVGVKSDALTVTLTNSGAAPLAISTFRIDGDDAADFSQAADCPVSPDTIAVGHSCTLYAAFTPGAAGVRTARLVVGDSAGTQTVDLSGSGAAAGTPLGGGPTDFTLPPGTWLADDFESGSLGRWSTLSSSASHAAPDPAVANSGTGSARIVNDRDGESTRLMADLAGGGHPQSYTRFCFRIGTDVHGGIEIANGRAINDEYPLGIRRFVINYNAYTKGLEGYFFNEDLQRLDLYAANGRVETGRWYCAELYLDESAQGHAELWLDGVSVGRVDGDLHAPSAYSRLYLWNQPDAGTVWFDDVAVTSSPSGPTGAGSAGLPGPVAAVSPAAVDLGAQTTQTTSAARDVTLTNTGTSAMSVGAVTTDGDFHETDDCPATLPPSVSCTAHVTFTPTATGARAGTLTFHDDAPGGPHSVPLSGTGVGSGVMDLSPAALTFDDRVIGSRSEAQAVTVRNTGSAPMTISTFRLTGADAGDFGQGATCPVSPDALPAGAQCTVYVSFTPSSAGAKSATLDIGANAASGPHTVALSGHGVTGFPEVTMSADTRDFGPQMAGVKSDALSVRLTNSGEAPLSITTFHLDGADAGDFAQAADCPVAPDTVAVGASCTIYVSFTPTSGGAKTARLVVGDNAASSPQVVTLTGTGTTAPPLQLSADRLAFGLQTSGTPSDARTVTVTNAGRSSLTLGAIGLSGADAADFAQANDCPAMLAASASCSVHVTFAPAGTGDRAASLDVGDQHAALSGTSLPAGTWLADDFESGSLRRWDALSSPGSHVAIDGTVAHGGSGSVRITNDADQESSRLMADLLGGGHPQSYTRFCFRVAPGLTGGIEIANGRAINDEYPLGIRRFVINYNAYTKGLEGYFFNEDLQRLDLYAANGQVETGRWYCLQLYLDESANGHAELWLDGVSVGRVDGDLHAPSAYSRLYLWNQPDAGTVWFDDVSVGATPGS